MKSSVSSRRSQMNFSGAAPLLRSAAQLFLMRPAQQFSTPSLTVSPPRKNPFHSTEGAEIHAGSETTPVRSRTRFKPRYLLHTPLHMAWTFAFKFSVLNLYCASLPSTHLASVGHSTFCSFLPAPFPFSPFRSHRGPLSRPTRTPPTLKAQRPTPSPHSSPVPLSRGRRAQPEPLTSGSFYL